MRRRAFFVFALLLNIIACAGSSASVGDPFGIDLGDGGTDGARGDSDPHNDASKGDAAAPANGCPPTRPAASSACAVPGRICEWTSTCGAADVGWCTPSAGWRIVAGLCQPGCPEYPGGPAPAGGTAAGGGSGPPNLGDNCTSGVQCNYPSSPFNQGRSCRCGTMADGKTQWTCDFWNDGWKTPPTTNPASTCAALQKCGAPACSRSCAAPDPIGCYCADDGLLYCKPIDCSQKPIEG